MNVPRTSHYTAQKSDENHTSAQKYSVYAKMRRIKQQKRSLLEVNIRHIGRHTVGSGSSMLPRGSGAHSFL